jgi:hypothetical protein
MQRKRVMKAGKERLLINSQRRNFRLSLVGSKHFKGFKQKKKEESECFQLSRLSDVKLFSNILFLTFF